MLKEENIEKLSEELNQHNAEILYPVGNEVLKLNQESQFTSLFRGILSGEEIKRTCLNTNRPMLNPCEDSYRWNGVSGGLDQNGYSIRLGNKWSVITSEFIDTSDIKGTLTYEQSEAQYYDLAPGQSILAVSQEKFNLPEWVIGLSWGKSTIARLGLLIAITPIESGWDGHLTIEITNNNGPYINEDKSKSHSGAKIRLWEGLPITQIVFHAVMPSKYSGVYNGQKYVPVNALDNK